MAIRQENIGRGIVTYDDETNELLDVNTTDDYKKRKEEATKDMLSKKDEFKQRGSLVVKSKLQENWTEFVDKLLSESDLDRVWYNGVNIEAALACMEKLSQGLPIEEAYKPINVFDTKKPCVYSGMELSNWQNNFITSVVDFYHERGIEFCDYRNFTVHNYRIRKST